MKTYYFKQEIVVYRYGMVTERSKEKALAAIDKGCFNVAGEPDVEDFTVTGNITLITEDQYKKAGGP